MYYQSVTLLFQVRQVGKSWTNEYYMHVGNKYVYLDAILEPAKSLKSGSYCLLQG